MEGLGRLTDEAALCRHDAPVDDGGFAPAEDRAPPLVAIVTPVYNGGKYLRQAMESVQRQTYPNIVHVVCDNACTDDSGAIIADYRDRRVPILLIENERTVPLAANWNKAFLHVPIAARYAKLLCADDLIRSDAIARCVALAEADPAIEVVLAQDVFDDRVHRAHLPGDRSTFDGGAIARAILHDEIGWLAYHHFFIRLHADYRDGRFIDDVWAPDPHVVLRSLLRGRLGYIHAPILYNRIHPESVTGREVNQGFNFELVHMHLLNRFGHAALDRRGYAHSLRLLKNTCCRLILRSRLAGRARRTRGLPAALAAGGVRLRAIDYARAILGWPLHSIRWRRAALPPGEAIDEAAFMRFEAPREAVRR